MILALDQHEHGVELEDGDHVVYDVDRDEAHFGAASVPGRAFVWEADRAAGGRMAPALRPRRLPARRRRIPAHASGPGPARPAARAHPDRHARGTSHDYGPVEWWYETGPDPVYAAASETEDTAFVRVVLPRNGRASARSRYVDPADEEKPKPQRARIFLDEPA